MALAFRMSLRSVRDNWRHSLAILTSIALGITGVGVLQGYIEESEKQFRVLYEQKSMYGQVIVESASKDLMSEDVAAKARELLANDKDVQTLVRFMPIEGMIAGPSNTMNFFGLAYDVAEGRVMRSQMWEWDTLYGKPLSTEEKGQVVVGRGLAELLGCDFTGRQVGFNSDGTFRPDKTGLECFDTDYLLTALTPKGKINALDVKISGIADVSLRELDDNWIMMPLEESETLFADRRVSIMGVALKDSAKAKEFSREITERFQKENLPLIAMRWQEHSLGSLYQSNIELLGILRNFILIIVIVVCVISTLTTITRTILERERATASLRAIGYTRRFIVRLYAVEGLILGIFGSVIGALGALVLTQMINLSGLMYLTPFTTSPIPFRISLVPETYALLAIGFSIVSSLVAGFAFHMRSRKTIAESLVS